MKRTLKLLGIIAAAAVIGLSVMGCGDGANGNDGAGGVPSELLGRWDSIENPGDTMVINSNGTMQETQNGETSTGTLSVSGGRITFTFYGMSLSGAWSISGGILTIIWEDGFGTERFQRPNGSDDDNVGDNDSAVDRTALYDAIAEAEVLLAATMTSVDGSNVPTTEYWTTATERAAFTDAIAAAEDVYDDDGANQAAIAAAIETLAYAQTLFENARALGTSPGWQPPTALLGRASAGVSHTMAIRDDNSLWGWGHQGEGRLGHGTVTAPGSTSPSPTRSGGPNQWNFVFVSASDVHTMGIRDDGSLWGWGLNLNGRIGFAGTLTGTSFGPMRVGTDNDWAHVSAGVSHTMAIRNDGSLWGWGNAQFGRLGNGSQAAVNQVQPVRIGNHNDWVYVSAGNFHTMGIREDGSLWAWGAPANGRLGHGSAYGGNVITPVRIGTDYWAHVSAGSTHTVAIRKDGSLWAWGENANGRLGNDSTTGNTTAPERIGEAYDWVFVSAGQAHTMGIREGGSLWAWGNNGGGRLGTGSTTGNITIPTRIGDDNDWAFVSTGNFHTVAIREDGSLFTFGSNVWGELGNGTTTSSSIPVLIWAAAD